MELNPSIEAEIKLHLRAITDLLDNTRIESNAGPKTVQRKEHRKKIASKPQKYSVYLLGERISARTLPAIIGRIILHFDRMAPDSLDALSRKRATKRSFLSRDASSIHPSSPHLNVRQSAGWFFSANIGCRDANRFLKALCHVSKLAYGDDLTEIKGSTFRAKGKWEWQ